MMHPFPIADVTNYHKPSDFKVQVFFILQFWKSEVQNVFYKAKIKVSAGLHSFRRLWEQICIIAFSLNSF